MLMEIQLQMQHKTAVSMGYVSIPAMVAIQTVVGIRLQALTVLRRQRSRRMLITAVRAAMFVGQGIHVYLENVR